MHKKRIGILDGFRAIAIIAVMLFHYYSRWMPPGNIISLYPYGDKYNYFGHGNLGVEFFLLLADLLYFIRLN